MPGFSSVREFADVADAGQELYATWRKSPSVGTTIGIWYDLSMAPGNPIPQYYAAAPLRFIALSRAGDVGLNHGQPVAPARKVLNQFTVISTSPLALPMPMILQDYIGFYPFVDQGTLDEQLLDNTVGPTRPIPAKGFQVMAVNVASGVGGQTFLIGYTNQAGVTGRVSQITQLNAAQFVGAIATSDRAITLARGPYLGLQDNDTGVRSIESFTMISGVDVGLTTLVLVNPVAQAQCRGVDAPSEYNYLVNYASCPVIEDDAYLNLICCPSGSLATTALHGDLSVTWN